MKLYKNAIIILLTLLCSISLYAQQSTVITLQDAIGIALDKNFDIQIAKTELAQAVANNTAGNAGMLPTVSARGGATASSTNTHMEFASGQEQNVTGAAAYGVTGAIALDWTLFDGMRMFINKNRLNELERNSSIAWKQQVQTTVAQVINTYSMVVRYKQELIALDTAMSLGKSRLDIAKAKFENGTAAKTDFLQATADFNENKSKYYNASIVLQQAKDSLMVLLGNTTLETFDVQDSLQLNKSLTYQEQSTWKEKNFQMQLAEQQKRMSELDLQLARAQHLPTLALNGGYNYSYNRSAAGFVLFNRAVGPGGNLTLNIPLYDGSNIRRQKAIARYEIDKSQMILDRLDLSLQRQYKTAWQRYDYALKILNLEQENIGYAQENVHIQQARFRVGVSNTLELKEAENSYVAALSRLTEAAYNLKIAETRLLELQNELVR